MKTYLQILALYLLGVGLIFLLNYDKPDSISGVFLTSLISLPFYVFLLTRYDYSHNLPLLIYISMSLLRVSVEGLYIAYIFSNGTYLNLSPVFRNGYDSIYFGGLILVIGNLVFITTSLLFWDKLYHGRTANRPSSAANSPELVLRTGVILLVSAISLEFASRFINFRYFGQAFVYCLQHAGPSGLLLLVIYKSYSKNLPRPVVIFALMYLMTKIPPLLDAYFKQQVIIYLLPLLYFAYVSILKKKRAGRALYAVLYGTFGFLAILILFNYHRLSREWMVSKLSPPPFAVKTKFLSEAVASSIPFTGPFHEKNRLPNEGVWAMFSRSDLYTTSAWIYNDVKSLGYKQDMVEGIKHAVIPRIFFPDKEKFSAGQHFAVELGHAEDSESVATSSAMGMFAAYYRNYGWMGVVFGACISGILYSVLIIYSSGRYLYNPAMTIVYFNLLVESLRWFEGGFHGSIPFFALMFVAFIPASFVYEKVFLRSTNI